MFRIRHECEKSLVTNCSPSAVSTAKWLSYYRIERKSTMSCYHGSKISGSQQSFLTETVICIVARCKKNMDYCFVVQSCKGKSWISIFPGFFVRHICRTTVCWDPETLLPFQRDVICIVARCKKNMDYCFVVQSCKGKSWISIFPGFFVRHICRTTVCWDPETLLPLQRDVATSPLYSRTRKLKGWFPLSRNFSVRADVKFTRVN